MMRSCSCLLALLLLCGAAGADDRPRWSFELAGGTFHSDIDDWATYYGDSRLTQLALGFAYKPLRLLEFGIEVGYRSDRGQGFAPAHGTVTGDVRYRLLPVHATVTLRGIFYEDQWLVPYLGAGAGRFPYRVSIEGQERISGSAGGHYARAGVQLLLDRLDRAAASDMQRSFGIDNTWLFIEAREDEAEAGGSELGGTAYLAGLLFEF